MEEKRRSFARRINHWPQQHGRLSEQVLYRKSVGERTAIDGLPGPEDDEPESGEVTAGGVTGGDLERERMESLRPGGEETGAWWWKRRRLGLGL
jgi:hypothetical protein